MAQSGHKEWRVGATRHRRKDRRGCVWDHTLCASGRSLVEGRGDRDTREALANRLEAVLALV